MLTKQQLQRIAQRRAIGLHAIERDDVQHLVLSILYSHSQAFLFKGGTALRVVHHSPRYSEDLDFNTTVDVDSTMSVLILDESPAMWHDGPAPPHTVTAARMSRTASPQPSQPGKEEKG